MFKPLLLLPLVAMVFRVPAAWSQVASPTPSADATSVQNSERSNSEKKSWTFLPVDDPTPNDGPSSGYKGHIADLFEDQKAIWSSPSRIRWSDATWLVPFGGVATGLFVTDREYSHSLSQNPTTLRHYKMVSNAALAGLIVGSASLYLFSYPTHNDHWRETGSLAGEAALNSLVTVEALKYSLRRERPYQGNGGGSFFSGGTSFPSEHAAAAWSVAGVIAHEYPGVLPSLFAYGTASAVSFARVRGRQHFPSDVLIGGALGYLIAQSVYRRRHEPEIGGRGWELTSEIVSEKTAHSPAYMGSPYVPIDSWIYPAFERLAALGYIRTEIIGLRPWTRLECARLIVEAGDLHTDGDSPAEVASLYEALSAEFAKDLVLLSGDQNLHAQVESVYTRVTGISGNPLTDGEHFGQTIWNDYGRPYREGFNSVVGTSAWSTAGPFVLYVRGEFQSAPSAPALSPGTLDFISYVDNLPYNAPQTPFAAVNRFRALDAYIGMNLGNWQFSFGKQSLWWGPGEQGAMLFTDNAGSLNKMFRVSRVSPISLPPVLGMSGGIRMELFIGQVAGQRFVNNSPQEGGNSTGLVGQYGKDLSPQPFLSGAKFSVKFTPNFEISMSKTTLLGGPGNPLTLKTLLKSSVGGHNAKSPLGDGRAALDFSYKMPKLRNWLTVYGDALQEDEISPLNRPYKSAFQFGLYMPRVPRISKLDMRIEGGTTNPLNFPSCVTCYYSNGQYVNGYTNNGHLIGTWIGRASQGESFRSTYWLAAQKKISVELRHHNIDRQYLPQGGTQNDVALNSDFFVKSGLRLSGTLQYEKWQIPLLATTRQSDWMTSFQVGFWPQNRAK